MENNQEINSAGKAPGIGAMGMLEHWAQVRQGFLQAMENIADEELFYSPRQGIWTLGLTICHIASVEELWFRGYVTHELSSLEEADYQLEDYPSIPALRLLLAEVHARTLSMFNNNGSAASVAAREVTLPWGPVISISEVLWHVLEHEIHHRGEVYLLMGLLGKEAPDV
jgi:uncharacterized damage-inducible protein DinB